MCWCMLKNDVCVYKIYDWNMDMYCFVVCKCVGVGELLFKVDLSEGVLMCLFFV